VTGNELSYNLVQSEVGEIEWSLSSQTLIISLNFLVCFYSKNVKFCSRIYGEFGNYIE